MAPTPPLPPGEGKGRGGAAAIRAPAAVRTRRHRALQACIKRVASRVHGATIDAVVRMAHAAWRAAPWRYATRKLQ